MILSRWHAGVNGYPSPSSSPLRSGRIARIRSSCPLLHGHKCADWNFGEEFARGIFGQPNAAVRCRIVRHITGMHSKIETAQSHEIWHLDVVDGGTMVALLVGDHKLAPS